MKQRNRFFLCIVLMASGLACHAQGSPSELSSQQQAVAKAEQYRRQLESADEKEQLDALAQLKQLGVAARDALPLLETFSSSPHCKTQRVKDATTDTISSIQRMQAHVEPSPKPMFPPGVRKPALYLYPPSDTDVSVRIVHKGSITAAWPPLQSSNMWKVKARPGGELTDSAGRGYRYLFWEGDWAEQPRVDRNTGFVVSGDEVRDFLARLLDELGLTHDEANDFVTYWYPVLSQHAFVYIHFLTEEYKRLVDVQIEPPCDSQLRIFMTYAPLEARAVVVPQKLKKFERRGFVLVEWGGGELSNGRVRKLQ